MPAEIPGQLTTEERRIITSAIVDARRKPKVLLEVGTWLGGGSTMTILAALGKNSEGHLWGIEADKSIYRQMLENIRLAVPESAARFTPLLGLSQEVIPNLLGEQDREFGIDFVFLDGGNNPGEQITEFQLLNRQMPIGATLMAHDAKLRKGKWLVPYVSRLDNWESKLCDVSIEGLFVAKKRAHKPSTESFRSARAQLLRLRLEPAEVAAAILPAKLCALVLALLPAKTRRRVAEGRDAG
jgi:predicted O-methyltransferase YrrM